MPDVPDPREQFRQVFGGGGEIRTVSVPGRVNLIGEHIDYHGLPVLPIAIRRYIRVVFRPRTDRRVRALSSGSYGLREFEWTPDLPPAAPGDWENYIRAAAQVVTGKWGNARGLPFTGIDAFVTSDLPAAAGLSSSTALLVAFTLALLQANRSTPTFEELMDVLPEGEHFVGTRGGGMDHAAVLASRSDCASRIEFDPIKVTPVRIPDDWAFLVAHSLVTAEKSGAARLEYNARRKAGTAALRRLGFPSYRAAIEGRSFAELENLALQGISAVEECDAFLHVTGEALRVRAAVSAMERADSGEFGILLSESHYSLRDRLKVSCPALDELVEAASAALAGGARLTGAGFGGFVVIFCTPQSREIVRRQLIETYYSKRPEFREEIHLLDADPGPGVLYASPTPTPPTPD
ncbi:MAG TPA: galactokinase family protein [Bryobacteraceae bacterium]